MSSLVGDTQQGPHFLQPKFPSWSPGAFPLMVVRAIVNHVLVYTISTAHITGTVLARNYSCIATVIAEVIVTNDDSRSNGIDAVKMLSQQQLLVPLQSQEQVSTCT